MQEWEVRRESYAELHRSGCFVIPNPWDIGSARYLAHLGFQALATTSAGFLFSRGRRDTTQGIRVEEVLAHVAEIVRATDLPVQADFQSGFADDPEGVAANVKRCVETGVAGLSIEDSTGRADAPLHDLPLAVRRIEAARDAIRASGAPVLLTGRAESYLVGHPRAHADALERLTAYAAAGADVLFAPGVKARDEIAAIIRAVAPLPVNMLVHTDIGLTVADLAALGVRRISVGGALARAAWTGFVRAAREIAERGSFTGLAGLVTFDELHRAMGTE